MYLYIYIHISQYSSWHIISAMKYSVQFSSLVQLCLTLCDPMDCSTPGFPVHHQLLELTHTHVYRVSDAIQPSHPLSSPSLPAQLCPTLGDPMDYTVHGILQAKILE